nr:NB-ARC domains-containing protein [Tanacetum cinerariifolium]
MECIGSEIKQRPKSEWIPEKKSKKRLDWWMSLDEEKNVKEPKRRSAKEWWKQEYCDELVRKRKKNKKKQGRESSTHNLNNNNWWQKDDEILEKIYIDDCDAIEEVVSNGDDEYEEVATSSQTNTTFLPRFDYLRLSGLPHLKLIDGTVKCSRVGFASPSLCQYSRKIEIHTCETLATLVPFSAVGKLQKLEELEIYSCLSLREIFE